MARTIKGTRISGLPPKVLLSLRQDASGSFPTIHRTASDNRTGNYRVFHNDNKVVPFNQKISNVGFSPHGLSHTVVYEEKEITVSSYVTEHTVTFEKTFTGVPYVLVTDINSTEGLENINVVVTFTGYTSTTINFSAPFRGTFVYRAIQDTTYGTPKIVERTPRFSSVYTNFIVSGAPVVDAHSFIPLAAGGTPTSKYITFFDTINEPSVAVTITSVTPSGVYITASADVRSLPIYAGFDTSGPIPVDVQGLVYPLGMTQDAMQVGLSPTGQTGLFKAPYVGSDGRITGLPIATSGSMIKGVADTFVTFTPGQDLQPFRDMANPEVDAKLTGNPFYATGSAMSVTGEGFQQPLWSKNKIEINLPIDTQATFGIYNNSSSIPNYPIAYYNFDRKTFEGIGNGHALMEYATGSNFDALFVSSCVGFGPAFSSYIGDAGTFQNYNLARPISTFGFPIAQKFNATSPQLLNMEDLISEPFLLEKVVVQFSGALVVVSSQPPGDPSSGIQRVSITSFFILNQPGYYHISPTTVDTNFNQNGFSAVTKRTIDFTNPNNKYKDVVTYLQFAKILESDDGWLPASITASLRDLNVVSPRPDYTQYDSVISWSDSYIMSGSSQGNVKSQITNPYMTSINGDGLSISAANTTTVGSEYPNRNMFGLQTGKDWRNSLQSPIVAGTHAEGAFSNIMYDMISFDVNPYVLTPKDKLIFGWQVPLPKFFAYYRDVTNKVELTFPSQVMKVTLYGSTLRVNPETNQLEEHHETLNQLFSSDSIHETITG
jgi:hypothetical protein